MPVNRDIDNDQKPRTDRQNRSLHLFYTQLAEALNDAGWDMKKTLRHDAEIPWSGENVKKFLWKPIQDAQLGKESTTQLTTKEIDVIFDTLNRHLGEKTGVYVDFPSLESLQHARRES